MTDPTTEALVAKLMALAREAGNEDRRHCIGKASGHDVALAYAALESALREAIDQGPVVAWCPGEELARLQSGRSAHVRSAKCDPSYMDGDVALYAAARASLAEPDLDQMPIGHQDITDNDPGPTTDKLANALRKLMPLASTKSEEWAAACAALAEPEPQPVALTAKPLKWEQHGANEWSDDRGFYITHDATEDEPYCAAWGEGDTERFLTLEAAQQWCHDELTRWLRDCAAPLYTHHKEST